MPKTIPNMPGDTATFATSNITNVSLTPAFEIDGILFKAGANAFTISPQALAMSGAGVANNSGVTESFQLEEYFFGFTFYGSYISFSNTASAGNATYTSDGFYYLSGGSNEVLFNNTSTAGSAVFINNNGFWPGTTTFLGGSTADTATFTNNASAQSDGSIGGYVSFQDQSTAGNAAIINNGGSATGGATVFRDSSTAAASTLIANRGASSATSGRFIFADDSSGGTARVELSGNELLFISHNPPGLTMGSIEGNGIIQLGFTNLSIGSNNLSTVFSGTIEESGSVTKVGKGKLTLTQASTYTGRTTIIKGTLLVTNRSGSATGTGPVSVRAGTLAGPGR